MCTRAIVAAAVALASFSWACGGDKQEAVSPAPVTSSSAAPAKADPPPAASAPPAPSAAPVASAAAPRCVPDPSDPPMTKQQEELLKKMETSGRADLVEKAQEIREVYCENNAKLRRQRQGGKP